MENFSTLLFVMELHSAAIQEEASRVDIIGQLPPDVSSSILRMLNGESLAAAACVNRRWLDLCRADRELRRRVRRQLHREGRGALQALQETVRPVLRATGAAFAPFARINTTGERPTREPRPSAGIHRPTDHVVVSHRNNAGNVPTSGNSVPAISRRLSSLALHFQEGFQTTKTNNSNVSRQRHGISACKEVAPMYSLGRVPAFSARMHEGLGQQKQRPYKKPKQFSQQKRSMRV